MATYSGPKCNVVNGKFRTCTTIFESIFRKLPLIPIFLFLLLYEKFQKSKLPNKFLPDLSSFNNRIAGWWYRIFCALHSDDPSWISVRRKASKEMNTLLKATFNNHNGKAKITYATYNLINYCYE